MKTDIPDKVLVKARQLHGDRFEYLGREKRPVGNSGEFHFLKLSCLTHGEFWQREASHLKGQGCRLCAIESSTDRQSMTLPEFLSKVAEENLSTFLYTKIERRKVNQGDSVKTKPYITAVCRNGHTIVALANNHIAKFIGCSKCSGVRSELSDYTIDAGISGAYFKKVNSRNILFGTCAIHGEVRLLDKGTMVCGKCKREEVGAVFTHSRASVVSRVQNSGTGLTLDESTYSNVGSYALFTCANGHNYEKRVSEVVSLGKGCKFCSKTVSSQNREIADFITNLGFAVEMEYTLAGRKTVDIFVPSKNLAMDFHGNIWHSDKYVTNTTRHRDRLRLANANGWTYIQIYSDEWSNRRSQVLSRITHLLGVSSTRVGARKCEVKELDKEEAVRFADAYHIQGSAKNFSRAFGLLHGGNLVAVMQIGRNVSVRNNRNSETLELIRYCTSSNVQGGLSRLIAYLRTIYSGRTLVTYSDDRLFSGEGYSKVGFVKLYTSSPDYYYVTSSNDTRLHKSNLQKSRIASKFGIVNPSATEKELTRSLGYYRIYDAGKSKWSLTL